MKNGSVDEPASGEPGHAVEVRDLSFRYPGGPGSAALSGINLELRRGEFLGITGPSGSGKSTFALCLTGLAPAHTGGRLTGEIRICGEAIAGKRPAEIAGKVGMVFQNPDVQLCFPGVKEELAFGPGNLCLSREDIEKRIEDTAAALGMDDLLGRNVNSLSGGQRQIVALAAVLTMRPRILVLDEPTAQLDSLNRKIVMDAIRALRGRVNVILISHDTGLLTGCDRVAVLVKGKIARTSAGETACAHPARLFRNLSFMEDVGLGIPAVASLVDAIGRKHDLDGNEMDALFHRAVRVLGDIP